MSLKLSFILPCYNVERYIADCLDSLYSQGLSEEEFEVICVNDCSTDGTRSIIVECLQKHSNLILIDHEQNLTAGGARNTGIKSANGEYIWFVDPDDIVVPNSAAIVYGMAKEKDVDVLMFNYETIDETNRCIKKDISFPDSDILEGQDYVVKYFANHFSRLSIVWRCLFRSSFLKEKDLWYPRIKKAQDVSFLWKAVLVAKRVASVSGVYYSYRRNPHSITKIKTDAHVAFSERVLFANEISKLLEAGDLKIRTIIQNDMGRTLEWCVNSNLELIKQLTSKERSRYYDEIKNNWAVVRQVRPYMNRKQKRVFSVVGGRRLWLLKVRALVALDKRKKNV